MSSFTGSPGAPDTWDHFRFSVAEGIAALTFDRPDKLNALTFEVYADLRDLLAWLPERDDIKVLVITGEGRGFCSGGDVHAIIGELLKSDHDRLLDFTRMTGAVVQNMRDCPIPIIASINGVAAGAGSVIALASDFRVLARSASFAFLFTRVGLAGADMGSAYLLPRMVGMSRATELLMLGNTINSGTADALGLAYKVVEDRDLPDVTHELARTLADGPTKAYAATKQLLTKEIDMSLADALELEAI
ncbi:MAG: enoyl-CoA hydratase family protein, partial [Actinobacteria bacterium]|nr:enoyl-CoA hydratase family protein [Actinomycetota bacterium]